MDESIFRAAFDASPNPYMVLDEQLRFVTANQAYLRTTRTTIDALVGRHLFDAFPNDPHDPANENARLLRESLERVMATRAPDVIAVIPYRVPRERNGAIVLEERFWSATHTPILDASGNVRWILQHTVDVTDMREAQDAAPDRRREFGVLERAQRVQQANYTLDAERQHLRRLFDQAPGFVAVLSGPTHVFDLVNAAYRRLIGGRDVVGQPVREALPEVEGQGFFEVLDRVYSTGESFVGRGVHVRLERQGGGRLEDVFADFVYQPLLDAEGGVTGIFVQGHDITTQKQLEVERESLLEQQRFLTEAIPQHVWSADAAGRLTTVNRRVLEYFGTTADRVLGPGWQAFVHPDDLAGSLERWKQSVSSGDDYEVEFRLRRADGTYRWHLARAVAMRDASGTPSRWFGTNTDIDDRKRALDELQARAEYERQLIGIVSHDLRNPLNAIGVAAALLAKIEHANPLHAKAVSRILSSSERARRLLRDFLDFTQARTLGRIPVSPGPTNVAHIARQVFDELRVVHPGRQATIESEGDTDGMWDGDRIAQVIGNLLSNAFQHSAPTAGIQLRTRGTPADVVIEVFNEGTAIPAADLARFFQPFERGDGAASVERSVGLGLFISGQIVEAHGGTISVDSTNDGTVFRVQLPR